MRSQQVNVVIDPMFFAGMVSQARKIVQESEGRAQGLEQLAQDVYKQACVRIQELVNVAEICTNPIAVKLPVCSSPR